MSIKRLSDYMRDTEGDDISKEITLLTAGIYVYGFQNVKALLDSMPSLYKAVKDWATSMGLKVVTGDELGLGENDRGDIVKSEKVKTEDCSTLCDGIVTTRDPIETLEEGYIVY